MSLQRSCTTEPVTAPLGISQDGVCGGTGGRDKVRIKETLAKPQKKSKPIFKETFFFFIIDSLSDVPRTLSVTLVSPRLTESRGALISQRYSPVSSWVTLCSVTVAPSIVARPSNVPERKDRRSGRPGRGNVFPGCRLKPLCYSHVLCSSHVQKNTTPNEG